MGNRGGNAGELGSLISRGVSLAALGLAIVLLAVNPARAAQKQGTREDLVRLLEDGPGAKAGKPEAPVVIVEFSDFQCVYCKKFLRETFPRVKERYIQPGTARIVYRHLAILGEASVQAANAAECAGEQEKFWPYHDLLFDRLGPLSFTASKLQGYAGELGLDPRAFAGCFDRGIHRERIRQETILGRRLGMTGTPSFLINGRLLIGAYPFEDFAKAIDEAIVASGGRPRPGPPAR